jgi:uncharacterized cupin superfamily protein
VSPPVVNLFGDDWDDERSRAGDVWKRMHVGRRLGSELLGASLFELEAGQRSFPYHFHYANEELLMVVAGTPTVRHPGGERDLRPGDVVVFRRGSEGAHQVLNRSDAPCRFVMLSTMRSPEIAVYPDSNKVGVFDQVPGPGKDGERELRAYLPLDAEVDYFDGE